MTVVDLKSEVKAHKIAAVVLTFNLPLDAHRAESIANYILVPMGSSRKIAIRSAQYDAATDSVTLLPKKRLSASATYQLTVVGTAPDGLTTTVGAFRPGSKRGDSGLIMSPPRKCLRRSDIPVRLSGRINTSADPNMLHNATFLGSGKKWPGDGCRLQIRA